jgi:hypothetical protein
MSSGEPKNPVVQQLDLLLSGYGFNCYKSENRARADDLLIRQQAAGSLSQTVGALSTLHSTYRLRYLPPPSRENPFPPREDLQRAADILALRGRVDQLAAGIRGMSAPTQDKIWKRFRQELDLLNQLLSTDYLLITLCDRVREAIAELTPQDWHEQARISEIDAALRELETVIRERQQILLIL